LLGHKRASKAIEDTLDDVKYEIQAICSESKLFAEPLDGGSEFLLLWCRRTRGSDVMASALEEA